MASSRRRLRRRNAAAISTPLSRSMAREAQAAGRVPRGDRPGARRRHARPAPCSRSTAASAAPSARGSRNTPRTRVSAGRIAKRQADAAAPRLAAVARASSASACRRKSSSRSGGWKRTFGVGDMGKLPVVRTLATLAHDCRRTELFQKELIAALQIVQPRRPAAARHDGRVCRRNSARPSSCRRPISSTASISTATAMSTCATRCRTCWPRPRTC